MVHTRRLLRTLRHVTPGQFAWRGLHVARSKAYGSLPSSLVLWIKNEGSPALALSEPFQLHTALPNDGIHVVELFRQGKVKYHQVEGSASDWSTDGRSRLWTYEKQYHVEVMATAASSLLTEREKLELLGQYIENWGRSCPPLKGAAWEPYPIARRTLHWALAVGALPSLGSSLNGRLVSHLRHLNWHLERHLLGNHLLCDLTALVAGSAVIDSPFTRELWLVSSRRLKAALGSQVLADGGYAERTVQYHNIVLRDLLWATALSARSGKDLGVDKLLAKMLEWSAKVSGTGSDPEDCTPWLNDAARDMTPAIGDLEILARQAGISWQPLPVNGHEGTLLFQDTGWILFAADRHRLVFDFGVVGPSEQPGHGHSDTLAFELTWDGRSFVTDTGVTTYESDKRRTYERSAGAHATISVDGNGTEEVWSSFRVGGRGKPRLVSVESSNSSIAIEAECKSFAGWTHYRHLMFKCNDRLRITDRIIGASPRAEKIAHLPLAPRWQVKLTEYGAAMTDGETRLRLNAQNAFLRAGWEGRGFGCAVSRSVLCIPITGEEVAYEVIAEP